MEDKREQKGENVFKAHKHILYKLRRRCDFDYSLLHGIELWYRKQ